jgi:ABC-type transport system substrate-binding protein
MLEANTDYWRQTPRMERLVMKSVPDATTRLSMLKKREANSAYGLLGALAEEVERDPNLKLEATVIATQWIAFTSEQYDPKSPWVDQRVRLEANLAFNRQAANEAETLGRSELTGSIIQCPFDYALPLEPYAYDPNKARQLLKEAGYPNGFNAGECSIDSVYAGVIEALENDLSAVGNRAQVRPMERAAHQAALREKTYKNLAFQGSEAFGNAATRIETFIHSQGGQSRIKDPRTSTPGMPSRQSSSIARSERLCSIRSSRECTMKLASCPSGSWGSYARSGRGRRSQAWGGSPCLPAPVLMRICS